MKQKRHKPEEIIRLFRKTDTYRFTAFGKAKFRQHPRMIW